MLPRTIKNRPVRARVHVTIRKSILDPQGQAVGQALRALGFSETKNCRIGKIVELELADGTPRERIEEMCRKLLANPIIEDFAIEVV